MRPHSSANPAEAGGEHTGADRGRGPVPASPAVPVPAVNTRPQSASNRANDRAVETEEDRALIAQAQAGDMGAFRKLVERHQRRAFAVAMGLVRDENDAREVVQDAFLRAYKSLPNFQGSASFFTWLYRIITNLSIDLMRKPGRQTTEFEDGRHTTDDEQDFPLLSKYDGSDPIDVVRRREIAARLQAALDALPSYHRAVIVLREIEGLSYEEMATTMGVSKGTIMSRLFHARQKLQRALADCYDEQIPGGRALPDGGDAPDGSDGEAGGGKGGTAP